MVKVQFGPDTINGFGTHLVAIGRSGPILIPWEVLREDIKFTQQTLLKQGGITVPAEENLRWGGLRLADQVCLASTNPVVISSVWGRDDPISLHERPHFKVLVDYKQLGYPDRELPIDYLGNPTMQMGRALAPIGTGSQGFRFGPNESGKTHYVEREVEALLAATRDGVDPLDPKTTVFVRLDIGEGRAPDLHEKDLIFDSYMESLLIFPFWGFGDFNSINNAEFSLGTAWRLAELGFDVIFTIESFWGLVLQYANVTGEKGFAAKGVPTEALRKAKDYLHAGTINGAGSLTALVTILIEGSLDQAQTRSAVVAQEIGLHNSTNKVAFMRLPQGSPRPWLAMSHTGTRRVDRMLDSERLALHLELVGDEAGTMPGRIRAKPDGTPRRGAEQLAYLRKLILDTGWDPKAWRVQWERDDRAGARQERDTAHQAVINAGSSLRGVTDKPGAVFAMAAVAGFTKDELLAQLFAALSGDERAAFFALLEKRGLLKGPAGAKPSDRLLLAAEALRGDQQAAEHLLEAIRICGLQPADLAESEAEDPVVKMMEISVLLKQLQQLRDQKVRGFNRKTAAKFVEAGRTPAEVLNHLLEGGDPKDLYRDTTEPEAD